MTNTWWGTVSDHIVDSIIAVYDKIGVFWILVCFFGFLVSNFANFFPSISGNVFVIFLEFLFCLWWC